MNIEELVVKISADIGELKKKLDEAGKETKKTDEKAKQSTESWTKALKAVGKVAASVAKTVEKSFSSAGKAVGSTFKGIGNVVAAPIKGLGKVVSNALGKINGMFEEAFTFGILSKAFQEFGTTITNFINRNEQVNASLSNLKGAVLTAVTPLIDVVIPALTKVADVLTGVLSKVASLTSSLTGKSTKATLEQAKALEKVAQAGKSASFDELNQLGTSTGLKTDFSGVESQLENIEDESKGIFDIIKDGVNKLFDFIDNGIAKILGYGPKISSAISGIASVGVTTVNRFFKSWNNLLDGINFAAVGKSVGNTLNSFITGINWNGIANTITSIFNGIVTSINEVLNAINLAEIGRNAAEFASSIVNSIDWNAFTETTKNGLKSISTFIDEFINNLDLSKLISNVQTWLLEVIPVAVQGVLDIFSALSTTLNESLTSINWAALVDELSKGINNIIVGIGDSIAGFNWGTFVSTLFDCVATVIDNVSTLVAQINWEGIVAGFIDGLFALIDKLFDGSLQNTISKLIGSLGAAGVRIGTELVKQIIERVKSVMNEIKDKGLWNWVKEKFKTLLIEPLNNMFLTFWDSLPSGIKDALTKALNWVKDITAKMVQPIKDIVNKIKDAFKQMGESIKNSFKTVINGIFGFLNSLISGAEIAINFIVKALNKLSWDVPDWVPIIGGKTFGFNKKEVTFKKIPLLATGGIVTQPTKAIIGEAGKEAVLPLENNTGWMDKLAEIFAAKLLREDKIVLNVDGRQLGWAAINNINSITKQTGNLQLALG